MDKMQSLNAFWSSFGLVAYDEATVPEEAQLPYITYTAADDDFGYSVSLTASIWYRSYFWDDITKKAEEISKRITRGGVMVPYDGGAMLIRKGSPFAQRVRDEDDTIRRIYINVEIEFLS